MNVAKHPKKTAFVFIMILLLSALGRAGSIPNELIPKSPHTLDTDLVVSAKSLIKKVQNNEKITLIDVRNQAEFEALHIKGAMNIPLYFIKNKPHLKDAPMVLVDQGLAFSRLSSVCRDLRKKGFDVRILDGGMAAWCSHKGPMVGELIEQINFHQVSSADFFFEKNFDQRIIVDVSAERLPDMEQLMPFAVHLPLVGSPKDWITPLKKFKAGHIKNDFTSIIVVNKDGEKYERFHSAFDRAGFKNVFFLEGGIDAYKSYLEGLALSWQPREKRMVSLNKCKSCQENEEASDK